MKRNYIAIIGVLLNYFMQTVFMSILLILMCVVKLKYHIRIFIAD